MIFTLKPSVDLNMMHNNRLPFILIPIALIAITILTSCAPWQPAQAAVTPTQTESRRTDAAEQVLAYLENRGDQSQNGCHVISGQQIGHGEQAGQYYADLVTDLQAETGQWVGLVAVDYYSWLGSTDYAGFNRPLIDHWNAGGLVSVSWSTPNPWTGGTAWDLSQADLTQLTDPADPLHAVWLEMLDEVAIGLTELRDAGVVVLWRPLHEMNGDWFWWGSVAHPGDAEPYTALWRQMYSYLTVEKGLDNLLWVYAASDELWEKPPVDFYYPGADVVDIVGQDIYSDTIDEVAYDKMLSLGKPFVLAEVGPLAQRDGSFDNQTVLEAIKTRYPETAYWLAWHDWTENGELQHLSIINNQNAAAVLNDPCVINRDEIDFSQPASNHTTFWPLEAENHDAMEGVEVFTNVIGFVDEGDWLRYDRVDFGSGATRFAVDIAVPDDFAGRTIGLHLDSLESEPIATLTVASTGGWDQYETQTLNIDPISGVHDLYIRFGNGAGVGNIDRFRFTPATLAGPHQPIPADLFGMHIHRATTPQNNWPSVPFSGWRLHDADGLFWRQLEPAQNQWEFAAFDKAVDLAEANGVELLYVLGQTPAWAAADPNAPSAYLVPGSSSPPADLTDWEDYVRTVVTRYKGKIAYYELWNEPDLSDFYSGDIETLVTLSRAAAAIIREVDPAARIVSPSPVPSFGEADWFDSYLTLGGGETFDIVGVHLYINGDDPPEFTPPVINATRQVMAKHGIAERPLWNTESNYGYLQQNILVTGDQARGYVARNYLVQWQAGVKRHYWYAWDNLNFVGLPFVEQDEVTPTAAAEVYALIQSWLIGTRLEQCTITLEEAWICSVVAADGRRGEIAWHPFAAVSYPLPASATQIRRLNGSTVSR